MNRIVVGVDGSEGSKQALRWAIEEATLREAILEVVHAYDSLPNVELMGTPVNAGKRLDAPRARAEELLEELTKGIEDVEVETHALPSMSPAQTLVDHSKGAVLLVLSARGLGPFRSLWVGSVTQHAARNATCPVVIVRNGER
ncbi:MAG TPA: universal stress protein [Actinomycetaceae bacterium]|nr:universal stress protein [Actinomycetaceae bacterium]